MTTPVPTSQLIFETSDITTSTLSTSLVLSQDTPIKDITHALTKTSHVKCLNIQNLQPITKHTIHDYQELLSAISTLPKLRHLSLPGSLVDFSIPSFPKLVQLIYTGIPLYRHLYKEPQITITIHNQPCLQLLHILNGENIDNILTKSPLPHLSQIEVFNTSLHVLTSTVINSPAGILISDLNPPPTFESA